MSTPSRSASMKGTKLWGHNKSTTTVTPSGAATPKRASIFSSAAATRATGAASASFQAKGPTSQTSTASPSQDQQQKQPPTMDNFSLLSSSVVSSSSRRVSLTQRTSVDLGGTNATPGSAMPEISTTTPVSIMRAKTPPTNSILSNAAASTLTAAVPNPTTMITSTNPTSTPTSAPPPPQPPPREGPVSIMRVKTPPANSISQTSSTLHHPTPPSQGKPPSRAGTLKSNTGGRSLSNPATGTLSLDTNNNSISNTGQIGLRRRTLNNHNNNNSALNTTTSASSSHQTTSTHNLVSRNRVTAATTMSLKRSSVSDRSGIGYTSAIELKSGNNALGKDMIGVVGPDGGAGTVRVASAPMERHNKRITFAPDVTGEGIDDVDISNSKRNSLAKRNPSGSSSYATVIADLTAETTTSPSSNSSLTSASNNNNSSNNNNNTKLPTNIDDLQTLVTEQSQRIAELESKLKESEKREADALKQKIAAVKELETNKKFLVTDIKSNELLKTQLQEEHQTNASLIIFNRSLKTQVAELEGMIEHLLQQKGATQLDIAAIMAKIENHKPVMPKIAKPSG